MPETGFSDEFVRGLGMEKDALAAEKRKLWDALRLALMRFDWERYEFEANDLYERNLVSLDQDISGEYFPVLTHAGEELIREALQSEGT